MARKETITKAHLVESAFALARSEGLENVTARKLAAKAGCSTQPIFRLYSNMEELWTEVFGKAVEFYDGYYTRCDKRNEEPFVNLGNAYINFAREEGNLFKMLFLSKERYGKSLYEVLNGSGGYVAAEMGKAKATGCANPGDLFTQMWIFIHGAACMTITGDYDLSVQETIALLKKTYNSFK